MNWKLMLLVLAAAIFCQAGYADEIQFKNGNRITGKIIRLTDGKLVFKSDIAGDITIDMKNVQTLSSDEPVIVNLKDGTGFNQKLVSAQPGRFAIQGSETTPKQELAVADIVSINPPKEKWTGNISMSLTSTHGNTKTNSLSGSANATRRTGKDRITANADYSRMKQRSKITGQDEIVEDWWRAKAEYDYFFTKKFYAYINSRYEKDAIALLERRITVGLGGGYQWIESSDMNFSTAAGVASLYEKYENATSDKNEATVELGYHFDKKLIENVSFINDLTYYPAFKNLSDYFLTTTAEIRSNLSKNFFVNFKTIFTYDSTPAIDAHKTDVKYMLGLGYNF